MLVLNKKKRRRWARVFQRGASCLFRQGWLSCRQEGRQSADTPAAPWASPPVFLFAPSFEPVWEWPFPHGQTHFLVTEVTDNERHNDARQDIGGDIQQELCHRLPPLSGGWPTLLIAFFASNHKAAPKKGPPFLPRAYRVCYAKKKSGNARSCC